MASISESRGGSTSSSSLGARKSQVYSSINSQEEEGLGADVRFSIDDDDDNDDHDGNDVGNGNDHHNDGDHDETYATNLSDDDDDHDDIFASSLPDAAGIPRTKPTKTNKTMQTLAGVAGNVLEWYDFAVFGYFSDVIGDVFFPPQDGHAAIFESYVVFGLAFLCRPIGGVLLGYVGDMYGRKRALEISIFLMAFPTFAMGCLPSYDQVGNWAIVLLTLVRMLQGLSVGGQLVSSLVYTCENNPKSKWGLYGSYVMAAANFNVVGGMHFDLNAGHVE